MTKRDLSKRLSFIETQKYLFSETLTVTHVFVQLREGLKNERVNGPNEDKTNVLILH